MEKLTRSGATLRERVTEMIRREIVIGRYKPGERLNESDLAAQLDVSRPLVREALRQLEGEDLIEVVPYRGPIIAALNSTTTRQIYETRLALEVAAAGVFAESKDIAAKRRLRAAVDSIANALEVGDRDGVVRAKEVFYEALIAGGRNPVMGRYIRQLQARVSHLWSSSLSVPGRADQSQNELVAVANAILDGNPAEARAAYETYLANAAEVAIAVVDMATSEGWDVA